MVKLLLAMAPSHEEERRGSATIATLKDAAAGKIELHDEEKGIHSDESSGEDLHTIEKVWHFEYKTERGIADRFRRF